MEPDLRKHFDVAVSADPGADPGEMARSAMVHGGRIRHRRHLAVAGAATAVVALAVTMGAVDVVNRTVSPERVPALSAPAAIVPMGMKAPAPGCSMQNADATDAVIYLSEATDQQVSQVGRQLEDDTRIASVAFESQETAYQRFAVLWQDSPDFVAAVTPEQMPASYSIRLHDRTQFTGLNRDYLNRPGVEAIIGQVCPASAPVGGAL